MLVNDFIYKHICSADYSILLQYLIYNLNPEHVRQKIDYTTVVENTGLTHKIVVDGFRYLHKRGFICVRNSDWNGCELFPSDFFVQFSKDFYADLEKTSAKLNGK